MKYFLICLTACLISFVCFFSCQSEFICFQIFIPYLIGVLCIILFIFSYLVFLYLNSKHIERKKFNSYWSLVFIIGLIIGFPLSEVASKIQNNNNQKNANKLIEKIYAFKANKGLYPKDIQELIPSDYNKIPTTSLGFETNEINYYLDKDGGFNIDYLDSGSSYNSYSSFTLKWESYTDWAGS